MCLCIVFFEIVLIFEFFVIWITYTGASILVAFGYLALVSEIEVRFDIKCRCKHSRCVSISFVRVSALSMFRYWVIHAAV